MVIKSLLVHSLVVVFVPHFPMVLLVVGDLLSPLLVHHQLVIHSAPLCVQMCLAHHDHIIIVSPLHLGETFCIPIFQFSELCLLSSSIVVLYLFELVYLLLLLGSCEFFMVFNSVIHLLIEVFVVVVVPVLFCIIFFVSVVVPLLLFSFILHILSFLLHFHRFSLICSTHNILEEGIVLLLSA